MNEHWNSKYGNDVLSLKGNSVSNKSLVWLEKIQVILNSLLKEVVGSREIVGDVARNRLHTM